MPGPKQNQIKRAMEKERRRYTDIKTGPMTTVAPLNIITQGKPVNLLMK